MQEHRLECGQAEEPVVQHLFEKLDIAQERCGRQGIATRGDRVRIGLELGDSIGQGGLRGRCAARSTGFHSFGLSPGVFWSMTSLAFSPRSLSFSPAFFSRSPACSLSSLSLSPACSFRSLSFSPVLCSSSLSLAPALSTASPALGATSSSFSPALVSTLLVASPLFSTAFPVAEAA